MATRMQQRRGTAAQWISTNSGNGPILAAGEIGYESDTNQIKIGDGINHWVDLAYFVDQTALNTSLGEYISSDLLGAANGVAQLNSSGKLVSDQIPNIDEITQDAIDSALVGGDGITKTYNDGANTITIDVDITSGDGLKIASNKLTVDDTVVQKRVANVSDTEIGYLDGVTSSIQTQLNAKLASADLTEAAQDAVNTALTAGTGITKTYDDAANTITVAVDTTAIQARVANVSDAEIGYLDGVTSAIQTQLDNKSTASKTETLTNKTLTSPVINTPTGITKSDVGLANVDNTTDANKPVSTATQTALDLKAPIASPTFTGTVSGVTKTHVGLANVDNTSDANKPVSTATQTALDAKAPLASPALTGTPTAPTATAGTNTTQVATTAFVGTAVANLVGTASSTLDTLGEIATALGNDANLSTTLTSAIGLKAPIDSPTFTGTVSGVTKSMVGLGNVDNTSDANKPVSTAAQTALDAKLASATAATTYAPIASPTFTGTVSGVTKSMVGLGNVDNTSDANKPVSTATQTALDAKAPLASPTFTGTVSLPANTITNTMMADDSVDTAEIKDSAVTSAKIANGTIVNANINASAAIALSKLATDPLARANHTGSQTASTISDFNEAAQDAVGGMLGTGLTYNDAANTITVDTTNIQLRVTGVSDIEIGYLDGVTSAIQTQIDAKLASTTAGTTYAPIASPTFTGTVSGVTKSMVGLGSVDNTADTAKPVSTAQQTALDLKANLAGPTFTGTVSAADLTLSGNLTVNGTTTTINSTTLSVDDKNIEIGSVDTPTNTTADGGGITLKGTSDKTFNWVNATSAWTSSEHLNLASGKSYYANGTLLKDVTETLTNKTISGASNTLTVRLANDVTGTLPIANGGTGATTASTAAAALLPSQTSNSGKYLTTDGSGTLSWGTVSGYSAPTIGSTSIASGATVTNLAGVTINSTTIPTSKTLVATDSTAYVVPSQTGNSGKYLTTDGTTSSWGTVSSYSAPTLGSTSIASGATVTTINGLTKIVAATVAKLDASGYEQDFDLLTIMGAL